MQKDEQPLSTESILITTPTCQSTETIELEKNKQCLNESTASPENISGEKITFHELESSEPQVFEHPVTASSNDYSQSITNIKELDIENVSNEAICHNQIKDIETIVKLDQGKMESTKANTLNTTPMSNLSVNTIIHEDSEANLPAVKTEQAKHSQSLNEAIEASDIKTYNTTKKQADNQGKKLKTARKGKKTHDKQLAAKSDISFIEQDTNIQEDKSYCGPDPHTALKSTTDNKHQAQTLEYNVKLDSLNVANSDKISDEFSVISKVTPQSAFVTQIEVQNLGENSDDLKTNAVDAKKLQLAKSKHVDTGFETHNTVLEEVQNIPTNSPKQEKGLLVSNATQEMEASQSNESQYLSTDQSNAVELNFTEAVESNMEKTSNIIEDVIPTQSLTLVNEDTKHMKDNSQRSSRSIEPSHVHESSLTLLQDKTCKIKNDSLSFSKAALEVTSSESHKQDESYKSEGLQTIDVLPKRSDLKLKPSRNDSVSRQEQIVMVEECLKVCDETNSNTKGHAKMSDENQISFVSEIANAAEKLSIIPRSDQTEVTIMSNTEPLEEQILETNATAQSVTFEIPSTDEHVSATEDLEPAMSITETSIQPVEVSQSKTKIEEKSKESALAGFQVSNENKNEEIITSDQLDDLKISKSEPTQSVVKVDENTPIQIQESIPSQAEHRSKPSEKAEETKLKADELCLTLIDSTTVTEKTSELPKSRPEKFRARKSRSPSISRRESHTLIAEEMKTSSMEHKIKRKKPSSSREASLSCIERVPLSIENSMELIIHSPKTTKASDEYFTDTATNLNILKGETETFSLGKTENECLKEDESNQLQLEEPDSSTSRLDIELHGSHIRNKVEANDSLASFDKEIPTKEESKPILEDQSAAILQQITLNEHAKEIDQNKFEAIHCVDSTEPATHRNEEFMISHEKLDSASPSDKPNLKKAKRSREHSLSRNQKENMSLESTHVLVPAEVNKHHASLSSQERNAKSLATENDFESYNFPKFQSEDLLEDTQTLGTDIDPNLSSNAKAATVLQPVFASAQEVIKPKGSTKSLEEHRKVKGKQTSDYLEENICQITSSEEIARPNLKTGERPSRAVRGTRHSEHILENVSLASEKEDELPLKLSGKPKKAAVSRESSQHRFQQENPTHDQNEHFIDKKINTGSAERKDHEDYLNSPQIPVNKGDKLMLGKTDKAESISDFVKDLAIDNRTNDLKSVIPTSELEQSAQVSATEFLEGVVTKDVPQIGDVFSAKPAINTGGNYLKQEKIAALGSAKHSEVVLSLETANSSSTMNEDLAVSAVKVIDQSGVLQKSPIEYKTAQLVDEPSSNLQLESHIAFEHVDDNKGPTSQSKCESEAKVLEMVSSSLTDTQIFETGKSFDTEKKEPAFISHLGNQSKLVQDGHTCETLNPFSGVANQNHPAEGSLVYNTNESQITSFQTQSDVSTVLNEQEKERAIPKISKMDSHTEEMNNPETICSSTFTVENRAQTARPKIQGSPYSASTKESKKLFETAKSFDESYNQISEARACETEKSMSINKPIIATKTQEIGQLKAQEDIQLGEHITLHVKSDEAYSDQAQVHVDSIENTPGFALEDSRNQLTPKVDVHDTLKGKDIVHISNLEQLQDHKDKSSDKVFATKIEEKLIDVASFEKEVHECGKLTEFGHLEPQNNNQVSQAIKTSEVSIVSESEELKVRPINKTTAISVDTTEKQHDVIVTETKADHVSQQFQKEMNEKASMICAPNQAVNVVLQKLGEQVEERKDLETVSVPNIVKEPSTSIKVDTDDQLETLHEISESKPKAKSRLPYDVAEKKSTSNTLENLTIKKSKQNKKVKANKIAEPNQLTSIDVVQTEAENATKGIDDMTSEKVNLSKMVNTNHDVMEGIKLESTEALKDVSRFLEICIFILKSYRFNQNKLSGV